MKASDGVFETSGLAEIDPLEINDAETDVSSDDVLLVPTVHVFDRVSVADVVAATARDGVDVDVAVPFRRCVGLQDTDREVGVLDGLIVIDSVATMLSDAVNVEVEVPPVLLWLDV